MGKLILTLNPGSSSLKYALYEVTQDQLISVVSGKLDSIGANGKTTPLFNVIEQLLNNLSQSDYFTAKQIQAIACRVVHGGPKLIHPTTVDKIVLEEIRSLSPLAPLHNPIDVELIESCSRLLKDVPVIAFFDTAFHQTMPPLASKYAIPDSLSGSSQLRRYGFHGLAHQNVSEKLIACLKLDNLPSKLITCHLGNGASLCAVKNGKSVDTTMGFTPMEGLVMGTRSGDLDPGLVLYLIQELKLSPADVNSLLNHQSGLLALSGISSDARILEEEASKGNLLAEFALDYFAYRAAKYIGSFVVVLGGIDAIAFSGGIGENSSAMRKRICQKISCLGLQIDNNANIEASGKDAQCFSTDKSSLSAWVIHANEELQMARDVLSLVPL